MSCPTNAIYAEEAFKKLREQYRTSRGSILKMAIYAWREKYELEDGAYPSTKEEHQQFSEILRDKKKADKKEFFSAPTVATLEELKERASELDAAYEPTILKNRVIEIAAKLDTFVSLFIARNKDKEYSKGEALAECGGFHKVMQMILDDLRWKQLNPQHNIKRIKNNHPEYTDEQVQAAYERIAAIDKSVIDHFDALSVLVAREIANRYSITLSYASGMHKYSYDEDVVGDRNMAKSPSTKKSKGRKRKEIEIIDDDASDDDDGYVNMMGDRYVDFRILDFGKTLSVKAKELLSQVVMMTPGEHSVPVTTDTGEYVHVNVMQAGTILSRLLVNATPENFIDILEQNKEVYPWLKHLLYLLSERDVEDKVTKEVKKDKTWLDRRTTIFVNFKRAQFNYTGTRLNDNKTGYTVHYENEKTQQNAVRREAANMCVSGATSQNRYSFYDHHGIVKKGLHGEEYTPRKTSARLKSIMDMSRGILMYNGVKHGWKKESAEAGKYAVEHESPEEAMRALLDSMEKSGDLDFLMESMIAMGIYTTKDDLRRLALRNVTMTEMKANKWGGWAAPWLNHGQDDGKRYTNRLYILAEKINDLYVKASTMSDGKTMTQFFDTSMDEWEEVEKIVGVAMEGNVESSVHAGDSTLQTFNKPSLIHYIFDSFGDAFVKENYDPYDGYSYKGKRVGWLKDGNGSHKLYEETQFNGVEYSKMNQAQIITNAIVHWFHGRKNGKLGYLYQVPIMADYSTAYNFISGESYRAFKNGASNEYLYNDEMVDPESDAVQEILGVTLAETERIGRAKKRIEDGNPLPMDEYREKFSMFPEFNDNGVYDEFKRREEKEGEEAARDYLRLEIAKQLRKYVDEDLATFNKLGIYNNRFFPYRDNEERIDSEIMVFDETTGKVTKQKVTKEMSEAWEKKHGYPMRKFDGNLTEFIINNYFARSEMTRMLVGGLYNFRDIDDFEKRMMLAHATRLPMFTEATWNGEKVGKENQRVVYAKDHKFVSVYKDQIGESLGYLEKKGLIGKSQKEFFLSQFDKIDDTDGQGYRTFESWREVRIMQDKWSDALETAYNRITKGEWTQEDVQMMIDAMSYANNDKPVYTGKETLTAKDGTKVDIPVLHKYAETVLLPEILIGAYNGARTIKGQSAPYISMSSALERLNDGKSREDKIDMILFTSGVKVGKHSEIDFVGEEDMEQAIVDQVTANAMSVHVLPYKYYGEAASTPVHAMDTRIAWSEQAEENIWGNLEDGETITVNGKSYPSKAVFSEFQKIKTHDANEAAKSLHNEIKDPKKLEKILQKQLASKSYVSPDLAFALRLTKEGRFAVPLFAPMTKHGSEELFFSMVRKAVTRHYVKGANLFQTSALGLDASSAPFKGGPSKDNLLEIKWNTDANGNKYVEYIECFIPIHDSRLLRYADENGMISPERLRELTSGNNPVIPKEVLDFVAYRTPADGEHSAFPLRVKGFTANIEGANIILPKEAMTLAGLDFDGDKLRCHFMDFDVEFNEEKALAQYDELEDPSFSFEEYVEMLKDEDNNPEMFRVVYDSYRMGVDPASQSQQARDNGRVQLALASMRTAYGTARMFIPGGSGESVRNAQQMYITRMSGDKKVQNILAEHGITAEKGIASSVYNALDRVGDKKIEEIYNDVVGGGSPFTTSHQGDSFERIVGGKQMVPSFAVMNGMSKVLQKANLFYNHYVAESGNVWELKIFGHKIDRIFGTRDYNGNMLALTLSRFLNAAVDNAKQAILGLINQRNELSAVTAFLIASGVPEKDVNIIMSQPVMVELGRRLNESKRRDYSDAVDQMIEELLPAKDALEPYPTLQGMRDFGKLGRNDLIDCVSLSYDDIIPSGFNKEGQATGYNEGVTKNIYLAQLKTLYFLKHTAPAALQLNTLMSMLRPESNSGSLKSTVEENVSKITQMENFIDKIGKSSYFRTEGGNSNSIRLMLSWIPVNSEWMPYQQLLNSLQYGDMFMEDFYAKYFPQMRKSWRKVMKYMSKHIYNYGGESDTAMKRIGTFMITWMMMKQPQFAGATDEEIEARRRYYVIDFPDKVGKLKQRIADTHTIEGRQKDPDAFKLRGNPFIKKLQIEYPEYSNQRPRIKFMSGGAKIGELQEDIRHGWAQLLNSSDPEIQQIGRDLFMYNFYTNGFGYGKYEFSHLAPIQVVLDVPGFLDALNNVLTQDFPDIVDDENSEIPEELQNFFDQFVMNFSDDNAVAWHFTTDRLPQEVLDSLGIPKKAGKDAIELSQMVSNRYFVHVMKAEGGGTDKILTKVVVDNGRVSAYPVAKIGYRNKRGQIFLEVNPMRNADDMKPIVTGDKSVYGEADENGVLPGYQYNNKRRVKTSYSVAKSGSAIGTATSMPTLANVTTVAVIADIENDKVLKQAMNGIETEEQTEEVQKPEPQESAPAEAQSTAETDVKIITPTDITDEMMASAPPAVRKIMEMMRKSGQSSSGPGSLKSLSIATRYAEDGKIKIGKFVVPATPSAIKEARKQRVFVRLNKRLDELFRQKGITRGVLYDFEERLHRDGIADFDTPRITAEGLIEMVRVANNVYGERAVPEEFAHLAVEMLGHEHPLVARLLNVLSNNEAALREAFGDQYNDYLEEYGHDMEKMRLEAAGKLIAKSLFEQQRLDTNPIRNLIHRVGDAIRAFMRRFTVDELQNAIYDADEVASTLAREMLSGRLMAQMDLGNVRSSGEFLAVSKDLSKKEDILNVLLKKSIQRLDIMRSRLKFKDQSTNEEVIAAINDQIETLEKAIKDHKLEIAIIGYLKDSLTLLSRAEESLDASINFGMGTATVCRNLNISRDTIYGTANIIEEIRKAASNGEINATPDLLSVLRDVEGQIDGFSIKYQQKAMIYFEEFLSNVYGAHGHTMTIGNDRGKTLTIHEMARRGERDITTASRLFDSLAHCNDYVLKAFSESTRNAKQNARKRAAHARARIEVAFSKLVRETGTRDQSFMFERESGRKTGKYISEEVAKNTLSKAQYDYYVEMMDIKKSIDDLLPEGEVAPLKIIMISKSHIERAMEDESVKAGITEMWEGIKNSILDTSDDDAYDEERIRVDFEGNRIDMLPIRYVHKNKKLSFDDMTDDVASSVMAYAGMGFEYDEMNSILDFLENARYMSSQRDIVKKAGNRTLMKTAREKEEGAVKNDEDEGYTYSEPYTVKQIHTKIQAVLNDFFLMQVYQQRQANEGNIPLTKIDKRKAVNAINHIVSLTQMAINLQQRISNVSTGFSMIMIETAGKGVFNAKDVAWAIDVYFRKELPNRLTSLGAVNTSSKMTLWNEKFDVQQDNGRDDRNRKYGKSWFAKTFNENLLYAGMMMGEDFLSSVTSLAAARNLDLVDENGKEVNLWDAYEVKYLDPENQAGGYLQLKSGLKKRDGTDFTFEDEKRFSRLVAGINFELQGIYNLDDKSAIQRYAFGALIIMYRKWIAPALKRRYGAAQYNLLKGQDTQGYYITLGQYIENVYKAVRAGQDIMTSIRLNWDKLTDYEKSNIKKAATEIAIILGCSVCIGVLGKIAPDDEEEEERSKFATWLDRMVLYQLLRLRNEIGSQAPTPMLVQEAQKILKSPAAAVRPIAAALDVFQLFWLPNYFTEVRSGRYKGKSKALKYAMDLPIISALNHIDGFIDPSGLINYYKNDQ